jgi:glycine/D-amino acid oxidase-like deaminating enzyme
LYSQILPEETGDADCCGFKPCGFIEVATSPEHMEYNRRVAAFNRLEGVDVQELSPNEIVDLFPLVDVEASECNDHTPILGGFYVPTDGRVNPYDTTMALAKVAKQKYGVDIRENCPVQGITKSKDGGMVPSVTGVTLEDGSHIAARRAVVNCAGMWARQLGEACGVHTIPNQAAEHYYLITEPMAEVDPNWPVVEDPSRYTYIRPEGGGLMVGIFERPGASWNTTSIPPDFSFGEITPDWDRMAPYLERAMSVVPTTLNVGAKNFFCGPESFTPDNSPVVGPAPELQNYYIAAGLNSIGILTGGGIGKVLAEWIDRDGIAPHNVDVTGINANRFHKNQSNPQYRQDRAPEALGNTYKLHFPDYSPETCRNVKKAPMHDRLVQQNACFRDVSGWESPAWYAPLGCEDALTKPSASTFKREDWFPYWKAEHEACRNEAALFDMR